MIFILLLIPQFLQPLLDNDYSQIWCLKTVSIPVIINQFLMLNPIFLTVLIIIISTMTTPVNIQNYDEPVDYTRQGQPIYKLDPKYLSNINQQHQETRQSVFGKDDRILIENNKVYPYSSMGLLVTEFHFNNQVHIGNGTATLIAPNILLTCAHNLYYKEKYNRFHLEAKNVYFFAGRNGQYHNGKYFAKFPLIFPDGYKTGRTFEQQKNYDFAFVVLTENVSNINPVPMFLDYPQTPNRIGIYGYPSDKGNYKTYLHGMVDSYKLNKFDQNQIQYTLDTYAGQSGSAIIVYENDGSRGIIGVHTRGSALSNFGNRLTMEKFKFAHRELKQKHRGLSLPRFRYRNA